MAQKDSVKVTDFIKFTNAGVVTANYVEVKEALIKSYKEVYGDDIDLSTGTADGVFISNLTLIINNILQSFNTIYSNLDVNSATGVYLDHLCALSNIDRKGATRSFASINVTNNSNAPITIYSCKSEELPNRPGFRVFDKAGIEWDWNGSVNELIIPNSPDSNTVQIIVDCANNGPIEAKPGWIYQTLISDNLDITQDQSAIIGRVEETDAELRFRRAQSNGANGITVIESLIGALLKLSGIEDVKIYNNNTSSDQTAKDGSIIKPHSIYTIIRQSYGVTIGNDIIGSIIYNKLTPGILTSKSSSTIAKEYNYIPYNNSIGNLSLLSSKVYWKQCEPVKPEISIKLTILEGFTKDIGDSIGASLIDYLNKLSISTDLTTINLLTQVAYADPLFLGRPTYVTGDITINSSDKYVNADTYYRYSKVNVSIVSNQCTITLS